MIDERHKFDADPSIQQKNVSYAWVKDLQPEDTVFLFDQPYTISVPSYNIIVVHAGLVTGIPLHSQQPVDMVTMRDNYAAYSTVAKTHLVKRNKKHNGPCGFYCFVEYIAFWVFRLNCLICEKICASHILNHFYARKQLCNSASQLSVRPSVRRSIYPSHGWISKKRFKLELPNFHHRLHGRL